VTKPRPVHLHPEHEPWGRQPGESALAYGQFAMYRDMGRTRTLAQAAELLTRSHPYLRAVAAAGHWADRAAAWDREQDRVYAEQLVQRRRDMAERHARIATGFLAKVVTRLTTLDPSELSAADLVRMTDLAAKLERAAYGEPTSTVAVVGPTGQPLEVADLTGMSAQQREARMVELRDELSRRLAAMGADDE
jgi:hypothetical protein